MDGSNYRPQREEPNDYHVETGGGRPLMLLVFLLLVVAGTFFFTYRQQVLDLAGCVTRSGWSCGASAPQPSSSRPQ